MGVTFLNTWDHQYRKIFVLEFSFLINNESLFFFIVLYFQIKKTLYRANISI